MRLLLLALTLIGSANAGPVTWYLHGVHYINDPGVTGYSFGQFTYDADLNVLSAWSIGDLGPPQGGHFPNTFACPDGPRCLPSGQTPTPTNIALSGLDSNG